MTAAATLIVTDVWKYGVFHYLDFRKQARCTRVCKLWNQILHELQYEYGQVKALRALNSITPLNLSLPSKEGKFYFEDCRGTYVLFSSFKNEQIKLWFGDVQTQQYLEVRQNPEAPFTGWLDVQWVSRDKFVTVIDRGREDSSFEVAVWEITKNVDAYQITKKIGRLFDKKVKAQGYNVLSIDNRVFIEAYNVLPGQKVQDFMLLDMQGSEMEEKKVAVPPLPSLIRIHASHRKMVFDWDLLSLSAYRLIDEGAARLVWKKTGRNFFDNVASNDQWFAAASYKEVKEFKVTFHVFDILEGKEVFNFTQKFTHRLNNGLVFLWLKGNFLIIRVDHELRIFHIPTRSHITSIPISNALTHPQLVESSNHPVHLVQIDQEVLRIVYEHKLDNDTLELKTHEIPLQNQHGKPNLSPPQILAAPLPPPEPTRGQRFKDFIYTFLALPFRFLRWVSSLL